MLKPYENMKTFNSLTLACAVAFAGVHLANASPTLRFSVDNGANWVVVDDNGGLDGNPQPGAIQYNGTITGIALSLVSGQGDPFTGTPSAPNMDLSVVVVSAQSANLIVQFSDTNLTTFPSETYVDSVSLGGDGTINQSSFRDSGNVLFGTTQTYSGLPVGTSPSGTALLLSSTGPVSSFNLFSSNAVVVNAIGNVPNSLTIESVFSLPNGGSSSLDAHLYAQPQPPCNCTVNFSGSPTLSICDGDPIPAVTATQDCGAGAVSVAVRVTGLVTNGICPKIITRTNSVTDNCGNLQTFVQTITNNCKPDCTVTPSVQKGVTGVSGYTASVADAGPGAQYYWTSANAVITDGQNSPKITWTAGSDATRMACICVRVTTAAGCVSQCCAYVPLTNGPSGCSYTPGGWGAPPNGGNVASLLYSNFTKFYSKGLIVGGTYTMKFTTASNLTVYLPAGTTPGVLKKSYTNPTGPTEAGEFADQVIALKLNVDFSNAGLIKPGLPNLKIAAGFPLAGTKVSDLLILVQKVLGGSTSSLPSGVSVSDLTKLMSGVNGNFDNCTSNNGALVF